MKSIRVIITALLLAGNVVANAQNVDEQKRDYVYKYTTYCFDKEDVSGNTKALAFNTYQKTLFLLAPNGNRSKVEKAALEYFKNMESLKDADYETMGEIRFVNEKASKAFEEEAAYKLKQDFPEIQDLVESYNSEEDSYMIIMYMGASNSIYRKVTNGMYSGKNIDEYINKHTEGHYTTRDAFQKAYKAKEPEALKYAEEMKHK